MKKVINKWCKYIIGVPSYACKHGCQNDISLLEQHSIEGKTEEELEKLGFVFLTREREGEKIMYNAFVKNEEKLYLPLPILQLPIPKRPTDLLSAIAYYKKLFPQYEFAFEVRLKNPSLMTPKPKKICTCENPKPNGIIYVDEDDKCIKCGREVCKPMKPKKLNKLDISYYETSWSNVCHELEEKLNQLTEAVNYLLEREKE